MIQLPRSRSGRRTAIDRTSVDEERASEVKRFSARGPRYEMKWRTWQ